MPLSNFHDRDIFLVPLLQSREWVAGFGSQKERAEARAISDWAFTEHFAAVVNHYELNSCKRGDDPPGLYATGKDHVAVEVTLIVSARKAIFDREDPHKAHIRRFCGRLDQLENSTKPFATRACQRTPLSGHILNQ